MANGLMTSQSEEVMYPAARKVLKICTAVIPLIPVTAMVRPVFLSVPRLQEYAGVILGLGATLCLLACLAVTPASWMGRFAGAVWWRRWLGLCVFFTGMAGVAVALLGVHSAPGAGRALAGHVQEWTGTLVVAALLPIALISNRYCQKHLGSSWKVWQRRLTWAAWGIIAIHIITLASWKTEVAFLTASAPLIFIRIKSVRKDISQWKRAGYEDPARWILAGLMGGSFAYGVSVLMWMEVSCIVQVSRIT